MALEFVYVPIFTGAFLVSLESYMTRLLVPLLLQLFICGNMKGHLQHKWGFMLLNSELNFCVAIAVLFPGSTFTWYCLEERWLFQLLYAYLTWLLRDMKGALNQWKGDCFQLDKRKLLSLSRDFTVFGPYSLVFVESYANDVTQELAQFYINLRHHHSSVLPSPLLHIHLEKKTGAIKQYLVYKQRIEYQVLEEIFQLKWPDFKSLVWHRWKSKIAKFTIIPLGDKLVLANGGIDRLLGVYMKEEERRVVTV